MDTISTTELVRNIGKYAYQVSVLGKSFLVTANGRPMFRVEPAAIGDRGIEDAAKGTPA